MVNEPTHSRVQQTELSRPPCDPLRSSRQLRHGSHLTLYADEPVSGRCLGGYQSLTQERRNDARERSKDLPCHAKAWPLCRQPSYERSCDGVESCFSFHFSAGPYKYCCTASSRRRESCAAADGERENRKSLSFPGSCNRRVTVREDASSATPKPVTERY